MRFRDFLEEQFKDKEFEKEFYNVLEQLRIKTRIKYRKEKDTEKEEIRRRNLMRRIRMRVFKFKKCPLCRRGKLIKKEIEEVFTYKGYRITIPDYIIHECNVCGGAIVDRETLKSSDVVLKEFKKYVDVIA